MLAENIGAFTLFWGIPGQVSNSTTFRARNDLFARFHDLVRFTRLECTLTYLLFVVCKCCHLWTQKVQIWVALELVSPLNTWCTSWLMTLNESKTKLMSFTLHNARIPTSYVLNNAEITLSTSYKYLGVHFQSDLTWHYHIDVVLASANRSLGLIKHSLKNAPPYIRKLAYLTLVRPKIEYASAIWDPVQAYLIQNIESLQNRAVRFIFFRLLTSFKHHCTKRSRRTWTLISSSPSSSPFAF